MGKGPAGARHPVSPAAYKQTFLLVPYPVYTSRKGKRRALYYLGVTHYSYGEGPSSRRTIHGKAQ